MTASLEIPIFGPETARHVQSMFTHQTHGSQTLRIELNASGSYGAGGLTPLISDLQAIKDLEIPIRIMIRPRGPPDAPQRDFIYSEAEFSEMIASIQSFKESGFMQVDRGDGFVFGVLQEGTDSTVKALGCTVDIEKCKILVAACRPYQTVFHRAFDEIVGSSKESSNASWQIALEQLKELGLNGILTSAGPGNAIDNVQTLISLQKEASEDIEIIIGGGVRSSNADRLIQISRAVTGDRMTWVHSSCMGVSKNGGKAFDAVEAERILGMVMD